MKHGTCIYFNGIQNKTCLRGVDYNSTWPDGPKPCIQWIPISARGGTHLRPGEEPIERRPMKGAAEATPCQFREEPTDEDVQRSRAEWEADVNKTIAAIKIAVQWSVKPKPDADRRGEVKCPICEGKLHLFQSAYNGHVHGKCETDGCVSWME